MPRIATMALLFAAAGVFEARNLTSLSALANADIWWHLRTGLWILQNHGLPHTGIFSQSPDSAWIAASWAYDVKLAIFYKLLGLASIPVFSISFKVALAVITFLLAGGRRGNFWAAAAISAIGQYILAAVPPTPIYCSALFFGVELLLLLESRRSASGRPLFWLLLLFIAWANLDPYFVYGLALLILFLAAIAFGAVTYGRDHRESEIANSPQFSSTGKPMATVALCALATLFTPYLYRPWGVFFARAFSAANPYLSDYRAPGFRQPQDYLLLLFVMAAFVALGMRRSRDPFLIGLIAISAAMSFHSQRDLWLVVLSVSAVLGETMNPAGPTESVIARETKRSAALSQSSNPNLRSLFIAAALALLIVALAAAILIPHPSEALLAKVGQNYPVAAANYIREHRLPQPLFNAFEWGGFLTWYLPEFPVAIDGRIDPYGDDFVVEYSKVISVEARYSDFPSMANAATIVLPRSSVMAQALSSLPAYKVAYSDNVATVLIRDANDEPR
ncbi:MAG: hypothetical protein WBS24_16520 [Terriglobales bacterium]